jgi:triosephosphate isomerase
MSTSKLIVANWKMNGGLSANQLLLDDIKAGWGAVHCRVGVCVPYPYLTQVQLLLAGTPIALGAQDVSIHATGAYTGEVSGSMLRDFGVRYCLVGHSERRQYHRESEVDVALKARQALACGITPIVCVGETLAQREAGETDSVVKRQLAAVIHENGHCISEIVVAYEPVWAIGTGKVATTDQAQEVHAFIRGLLVKLYGDTIAQKVRILYGGSMKPANAPELLSQKDIDGGLIGGAALEARSFVELVKAAAAVK